jgi:hypothetical protein
MLRAVVGWQKENGSAAFLRVSRSRVGTKQQGQLISAAKSAAQRRANARWLELLGARKKADRSGKEPWQA